MTSTQKEGEGTMKGWGTEGNGRDTFLGNRFHLLYQTGQTE